MVLRIRVSSTRLCPSTRRGDIKPISDGVVKLLVYRGFLQPRGVYGGREKIRSVSTISIWNRLTVSSSPRPCPPLSPWVDHKTPTLLRRNRLVRSISITSTNNSSISSTSFQSPVEKVSSSIMDLVHEYAAKPQKVITLDELMRMGQSNLLLDDRRGRMGKRLAAERILMDYAQMLQNELPIRLARRVVDLDQVPKLRDMPSVQSVKDIYISSLLAILDAEDPNTSPLTEESFGQLLDGLYRKHSTVLLKMAQGAHEFRQLVRQGQVPGTSYGRLDDPSSLSFSQHDECQAFLDRFYSSRVGIRVLAGQYLALREQLLELPSTSSVSKEYIGMICKTSPYRIVNRAIQDATRLCEDQFGSAPTVSVHGRVDLTFSYLPTHLHYILLELIKNAMRATMESHRGDDVVTCPSSLGSHSQKSVPNVTIIIADSPDNEDVVIKVCDEGGGIARSQMNSIWSYLFTTADPDVQESVLQPGSEKHPPSKTSSTTSPTSPILAGLGFGLPMSRAYARYFGGDLDLISLEGYGTDAYLYLPRLTPDNSSTGTPSGFHNDESLQRIQMRRTSLQI